jgi:Holliday junction resolvase RusA-like endonuclease
LSDTLTKTLPDAASGEIRLGVVPLGKPRMTQSDKWRVDPDHSDAQKRQRPAVTRYYAFKDDLRSLIQVPDWGEDDVLSLTFIIPMPKSWPAKKRELMNGAPHMQKPDLDNLIKAFKDALFDDDSVVHTYGSMTKRWGDAGSIIVHQ